MSITNTSQWILDNKKKMHQEMKSRYFNLRIEAKNEGFELPETFEKEDRHELLETFNALDKAMDYTVNLTDFMIDVLGYRQCSQCGEFFYSGYCVDGGMDYFCSDLCLHSVYTEDEWLEMYDDGNSESYYTEWDIEW